MQEVWDEGCMKLDPPPLPGLMPIQKTCDIKPSKQAGYITPWKFVQKALTPQIFFAKIWTSLPPSGPPDFQFSDVISSIYKFCELFQKYLIGICIDFYKCHLLTSVVPVLLHVFKTNIQNKYSERRVKVWRGFIKVIVFSKWYKYLIKQTNQLIFDNCFLKLWSNT
jgi:hypothetical protein